MLKGEDIICGTSTTGTGTLTLAQTPLPPGGADFFQWLTASGVGFANGAAVLVPYIIKEYNDNTFLTVKQTEVGWGTLTLGASLTASTLARTTVASTVTSENTSVATYSTGTTAITIGTAANVLIFIGPRAMDAITFTPYFDLTLGSQIGCTGLTTAVLAASPPSNTVINGSDHYWVLSIGKPILIKKVTMNVTTLSTGTSTVFFRLYAMDTTGRPGRLLCDYGAVGGANPLNTFGSIATAAHATGFYATPGEYAGNVFLTFSSTATSPAMAGLGGLHCSAFGLSGATPICVATATGGSSTAPATANLTGYAGDTGGFRNNPFFASFRSS